MSSGKKIGKRCPGNQHPAYTLQRYYLTARQAEMKCTACEYHYFRPMMENERFALREEVKFLVDATNSSVFSLRQARGDTSW